MVLTLKRKVEKKYHGGFIDVNKAINDSKNKFEKAVKKVASKITSSKNVLEDAVKPSVNLLNYMKHLKAAQRR